MQYGTWFINVVEMVYFVCTATLVGVPVISVLGGSTLTMAKHLQPPEDPCGLDGLDFSFRFDPAVDQHSDGFRVPLEPYSDPFFLI